MTFVSARIGNDISLKHDYTVIESHLQATLKQTRCFVVVWFNEQQRACSHDYSMRHDSSYKECLLIVHLFQLEHIRTISHMYSRQYDRIHI